MMFLVDTSVWINHFRSHNAALTELLLDERVLCHPCVIGELACGNLRNRSEILSLLQALPKAVSATGSEVLSFIDSSKLYGKGIGWIDAHLLASCRLSKASLFTLDKKLSKLYATISG